MSAAVMSSAVITPAVIVARPRHTLLRCIIAAAFSLGVWGAAMPAHAADQATHVAAAQTYEPAGYVPLPDGMVEPDLDSLLETPRGVAQGAPLDIDSIAMGAADIEIEIELPIVPQDALTACEAETKSTGAMEKCLKQRHKLSEQGLEDAVLDARHRLNADDTNIMHAFTSANLDFVAQRDAECFSRREGTPDEGHAGNVQLSCLTELNDARAQILRDMQ